ncbi:MAG: hypothetical protein ACI396_02190, partial [Acutalibacteraceae bacterium]
KALFSRTIDTGLKHGTVTVLINGMPLEITQMRCDGEYTDHRHPNNVIPTKNLADDLARRDFTVNAIAMDRHGNITDLFGGADDINRKIIRCVGDANRRFDEDALRIMRTFRFCSQLGFEIDDETKTAALKNAPLLESISAERIYAELKKTLIGDNPAALEPLIKTNALKKYGLCGNVDLSILNSAYNDIDVRLALLFIICESSVQSAMNALKSDKATARKVCTLCRLYRENALYDIDEIDLKRLIFENGFENCKLLISLYGSFGKYDVTRTKNMLDTIQNQPIAIADLAINGRDLTDIGISGEQVSKTLNMLLQKVWENPQLNDKNTLIDIAKSTEL